MRKRWKRAALGVVAAAAVVPAHARAASGKIVAFGDSLIDTRIVCPFLTVPVFYPGQKQFGTCSNGRGTLEALDLQLDAYTFDRADDYAAGGAGIDRFNVASLVVPGAPGVQAQVEAFVAGGGRIGANDLVIFTGGGNDRFNLVFEPTLTPAALATRELTALGSNVSAIVGTGARNIVVFSGNATGMTATNFGQFDDLLARGMPGVLAGIARPGVRIRLFNFAGLRQSALADPARYGFSTALPCVNDPACVNAPVAQQNDRFQFDIHPTEAGHLLIARYVARLVTSADGLPAETESADGAASHLNAVQFRRLDDTRATDATGSNLFLQGTYQNTSRGSRATPDGAAVGYGSDGEGLFGGVEHRWASGLRAGASFGYLRTDADLDGGFGHVKLDTYQLSGFASVGGIAGYADVVASYARHRLDVSRAGVVGDLRGHPDGYSWVVAGRAGKLVALGPVRAGPVGQLGYTSTVIGGYVEGGDPLLDQIVDRQRIETLTGLAGLQVRTPGTGVSAWAQASYAHEFLNDDRSTLTASTFAPGIPIFSSVRGYGERNYGVAEAGLVGRLGGRLSLHADGRATFARSGGEDYSVAAGLALAL